MQKTEKLYFAYGSNLLRKQMQLRCPHCTYKGLARLTGWKFQYDGRSTKWHNMAVGNIVPFARHEVWGAIYSLCEKDITELDRYEGYPNDYRRYWVNVTLPASGKREKVFVYARQGKQPGKPSQKYESVVMTGAKEDGLPLEYIENSLHISSKVNELA